METIRSFGLARGTDVMEHFRSNMQVGQWIDVIDTVDQWLEAQIIDIRHIDYGARVCCLTNNAPCEHFDGAEVYVHYNGWPEQWDEWINTTSSRIQPLRTHTLQSMRSSMASPYPTVRPDAAQLQHETQTHNLDDYVTQSIDILDQVKAVLEHYQEVRREGSDRTSDSDFATVSRQVIPALDRTGRLMTDVSR